MANRPNRYKDMERNITIAIIVDVILFITFLVASGNATAWLKVVTLIMILLLSSLCLGVLYLTKEILRPRSLWMTVASTAVLVCTIFSLVLRFPSPNPMKQFDAETTTAVSESITTEP